jgi:hypothetical protein
LGDQIVRIGPELELWQRETMVGRSFARPGRVAKMNFTCGGGSSSVLRSALKAAARAVLLVR